MNEINISKEFKKLQVEFPDLNNVELIMSDFPGGKPHQLLSLFLEKEIPDCKGMFRVDDSGNCSIQILSGMSLLITLLVLLHECKHAMQFFSNQFENENDERTKYVLEESDADKFAVEQFKLRYEKFFNKQKIAEVLENWEKSHLIYAYHDNSILKKYIEELNAN